MFAVCYFIEENDFSLHLAIMFCVALLWFELCRWCFKCVTDFKTFDLVWCDFKFYSDQIPTIGIKIFIFNLKLGKTVSTSIVWGRLLDEVDMNVHRQILNIPAGFKRFYNYSQMQINSAIWQNDGKCQVLPWIQFHFIVMQYIS